MIKPINDLQNRVARLEGALGITNNALDPARAIDRLLDDGKNAPTVPTASELGGLYQGVVVSTKDPLVRGRVRIYVPRLNAYEPYNDSSKLIWAEVASFGGSLDNQGAVFTPPAGSCVLVGFVEGNEQRPVVVGCYHIDRRGKDQPIAEEEERWGGKDGGRRTEGHLIGEPNNLLPPWNNESYDDVDRNPGDVKGETGKKLPHIYGYKSPEQHFLRFDDGAYENGYKGKGAILQTGKGSVLYMKDDAVNSADDIYNGKLRDFDAELYPGGVESRRAAHNLHRIELPQTGVQVQSFGGHRIIMDDSLDRRFSSKDNMWTAKFHGDDSPLRSSMKLQSISEHQIVLRDDEISNEERSDKDGIFLQTATGVNLELSDHTIGSKAGPRRGVRVRTTSNHVFEMLDEGCSANSPKKRATNSGRDASLKKRTAASSQQKSRQQKRRGYEKIEFISPQRTFEAMTSLLQKLIRDLTGREDVADLVLKVISMMIAGASREEAAAEAEENGVSGQAKAILVETSEAIAEGKTPQEVMVAAAKAASKSSITVAPDEDEIRARRVELAIESITNAKIGEPQTSGMIGNLVRNVVAGRSQAFSFAEVAEAVGLPKDVIRAYGSGASAGGTYNSSASADVAVEQGVNYGAVGVSGPLASMTRSGSVPTGAATPFSGTGSPVMAAASSYIGVPQVPYDIGRISGGSQNIAIVSDEAGQISRQTAGAQFRTRVDILAGNPAARLFAGRRFTAGSANVGMPVEYFSRENDG